MAKDYTIGLDIGTNSVGWAVITDEYRLMAKKMSIHGNTEKKKVKKNFWGARLFDEGQTAEARRSKTDNTPKIDAQKIPYIGIAKIFAEEILKIDTNFFVRLDESFLNPEDKQYTRFQSSPQWQKKNRIIKHT